MIILFFLLMQDLMCAGGADRFLDKLFWYARLDLNQRSSAPEADALSPGPRAHADYVNKKLNM